VGSGVVDSIPARLPADGLAKIGNVEMKPELSFTAPSR
jgi:hypothetical protein